MIFYLHLKILYGRMTLLYEFGLLTDNVEYHEGTGFLKADRLGSICIFTYTAFFISEKEIFYNFIGEKGFHFPSCL